MCARCMKVCGTLDRVDLEVTWRGSKVSTQSDKRARRDSRVGKVGSIRNRRRARVILGRARRCGPDAGRARPVSCTERQQGCEACVRQKHVPQAVRSLSLNRISFKQLICAILEALTRPAAYRRSATRCRTWTSSKCRRACPTLKSLGSRS